MPNRTILATRQSHPTSSPWTPEAEARALRLFIVEGLSASEVATALGAGVSRAAVLSKVRRLGYRKREASPPRLDVLRTAPAAKVRVRIERRLPPVRPTQPLPPLREAPATGRPTVLAALPANGCRWPIDDPGPGRMHLALFCAGPTVGRAYCAVHRDLACRSLAPRSAP